MNGTSPPGPLSTRGEGENGPTPPVPGGERQTAAAPHPRPLSCAHTTRPGEGRTATYPYRAAHPFRDCAHGNSTTIGWLLKVSSIESTLVRVWIGEGAMVGS